MEALFILVVGGVVLASPILSLIGLIRGEQYRRRVRTLEDTMRTLEARLGALTRRQQQAAVAPSEAVPAPGPPPMATPASPPPPLAEAPPPVEAPLPVEPPPAAPARPAMGVPPPPFTRPPEPAVERPRRPAPPNGSGPDFATNLGPRLLIGAGALAFVVFVALFVKYAWDNNWVGPTGRVLMGAAASVASIVAGLQLLRGRYRPLGQGLAGMGFAGLYVSAFGAHGFYDLVSREVAGVLMALITAAAVALAWRLDVRFMATLAWIGGYLTPVLLTTGEDRALGLFMYLALLDAGALFIDRRRPWPETAPLAAAGTVLLYAGWYSRHFTAARFDVAAFGVVLFTALFLLGLAPDKRRSWSAAATIAGSTVGLLVLAASTDRPVPLLLLSLSLGAVTLMVLRAWGGAAAGMALLAALVPFVGWGMSHYDPASFGIAAAWVAGAVLLLFGAEGLGRAAGADAADEGTAVPGILHGLALAVAGLAAAAMAGSTDNARGLSLFLLALAGLAVVARSRWEAAELVGVLGAALTVAVWMAEHFEPGRNGDAWVLAFPVAGAYLLSLAVRGLVLRQALGVADVMTHLVGATLLWGTLFRVLYETNPSALGLASVGLAALYLGLGLTARRQPAADLLLVRTCLGLAAVFVTIAIPVQLGLHGITLAWALEGLLLVALGLRFASPLARAGGAFVLAMAVLRLLARHLPLRHAGEPFTPVLNASFGTWAFVIAALAAAGLLARRAEVAGLFDRAAALVSSVGALLLLFTLLTAETSDVFRQMAVQALASGDLAAMEQARLRGRLALSVLWTVFATGLLAGGLGMRSRPLFYASYGLFAVTAFKVVLVDLSTLHTVYRMLSFLALGLLLLAGAYLNLRFRERLMPSEAAP